MATVYRDIKAAIENYWLTKFLEGQTIFPNVSEPDKTIDEFFRLKIDFVSRIRETLTGSPTTGQKVTGLLTVQVFNPVNTKAVAAYVSVDKVVDAFNELRLPAGTDYDDICFNVPQVNDLGNTSPEWHQVNVLCPFSQLLIIKP